MTPRSFYRVQWETSWTRYSDDEGFWPEAAYRRSLSQSIDLDVILGHLNWGDRRVVSTPFVSVFDDRGMGQTHARNERAC